MASLRALVPPLSAVLCLVLVFGDWPAPGQGAAAAPCETPLPVSGAQASELLAEERPFTLTDPDLLFSYTSPDWHDAAPIEVPDGPELTDEQTADALRAFLERRFACAPARVQEGMKYFSDPTARAKIPHPTLRAALAALTGTVAEPAIEFALYGAPIRLINFNMYIEIGAGLPSRFAGVYIHLDGTESVIVDRRYRFLPFGAFCAMLAHELLHTGVDEDTAGLPEEAIASSIEALVYMETLLVDPTLAELTDDFTRLSNNHLAIARINSGPAGSDRLNLFVPEGEESIDPLATEPLLEFYEYYAYWNAPAGDPDFRERETEGNQLLRDILELLAEPGSSPPDDADFDQETVEFVDQNQAVLSPAELIAAACVLRLDVPCD